MKSTARKLAIAGLMALVLGTNAGARPALAGDTGRSRTLAPAADPQYHWTFYATFATAGACFAAAAAYKNEYWWVEATTCIRDATHNTWQMFYES